MAAKDYEIACAVFNAYIAKKKKKPSNTMSEDRREITDEEIYRLIDWKINNFIEDNDKTEGGFQFDSLMNDGYTVTVKISKKN